MSDRSVTHSTFTIERTFDASPARVFAAYADPGIKARWFVGPDDWGVSQFELDFRVGGREINRGGPPEGPMHTFEARYFDIVPNQRIVFAYDMLMDEIRISVSLATVELKADGGGTRMIFTEQGAYFDGYDDPAGREKGTCDLLDALARELRAAAVGAGTTVGGSN